MILLNPLSINYPALTNNYVLVTLYLLPFMLLNYSTYFNKVVRGCCGKLKRLIIGKRITAADAHPFTIQSSLEQLDQKKGLPLGFPASVATLILPNDPMG